MSTSRMTRRALLRLLSTIGGAFYLKPVAALSEFRPTDKQELLERKLTGLLLQKNSAKVVGRKYVEGVRVSKKILIERLCRALNKNPDDILLISDERLRALVVARQRDDFDRGRVVNVDGWILSQTEVYLCALTELEG